MDNLYYTDIKPSLTTPIIDGTLEQLTKLLLSFGFSEVDVSTVTYWRTFVSTDDFRLVWKGTINVAAPGLRKIKFKDKHGTCIVFEGEVTINLNDEAIQYTDEEYDYGVYIYEISTGKTYSSCFLYDGKEELLKGFHVTKEKIPPENSEVTECEIPDSNIPLLPGMKEYGIPGYCIGDQSIYGVGTYAKNSTFPKERGHINRAEKGGLLQLGERPYNWKFTTLGVPYTSRELNNYTESKKLYIKKTSDFYFLGTTENKWITKVSRSKCNYIIILNNYFQLDSESCDFHWEMLADLMKTPLTKYSYSLFALYNGAIQIKPTYYIVDFDSLPENETVCLFNQDLLGHYKSAPSFVREDLDIIAIEKKDMAINFMLSWNTDTSSNNVQKTGETKTFRYRDIGFPDRSGTISIEEGIRYLMKPDGVTDDMLGMWNYREYESYCLTASMKVFSQFTATKLQTQDLMKDKRAGCLFIPLQNLAGDTDANIGRSRNYNVFLTCLLLPYWVKERSDHLFVGGMNSKDTPRSISRKFGDNTWTFYTEAYKPYSSGTWYSTFGTGQKELPKDYFPEPSWTTHSDHTKTLGSYTAYVCPLQKVNGNKCTYYNQEDNPESSGNGVYSLMIQGTRNHDAYAYWQEEAGSILRELHQYKWIVAHPNQGNQNYDETFIISTLNPDYVGYGWENWDWLKENNYIHSYNNYLIWFNWCFINDRPGVKGIYYIDMNIMGPRLSYFDVLICMKDDEAAPQEAEKIVIKPNILTGKYIWDSYTGEKPISVGGATEVGEAIEVEGRLSKTCTIIWHDNTTQVSRINTLIQTTIYKET